MPIFVSDGKTPLESTGVGGASLDEVNFGDGALGDVTISGNTDRTETALEGHQCYRVYRHRAVQRRFCPIGSSSSLSQTTGMELPIYRFNSHTPCLRRP